MPNPQSNLRTNTEKSTGDVYDVVIVGAGPIGLATAIGLRKSGIENILVVDQTRAFRQVGQVLDLLPNGLKSLKNLDPEAYAAVKETGMGFMNPPQSHGEKTSEKKPAKTSPEWVYKNLQGETIRSISLAFDQWFKNYGEGRVSIAWYNLQTSLRNLIPEDRVKANHRCINVVDEPENGCVRIDCVCDLGTETNPYAYWTEGQKIDDRPQNLDPTSPQLVTKSFRAKLIVAADGINSTIRKVLYKDSLYSDFAKPEYSGFAAISCREIAEIPPKIQTQVDEKFLQNSPIVTISNAAEITDSLDELRMMLFRRPGSFMGYILHLSVSLASLEGKSASSLLELAMQHLEKAGYPDVLQELVRLSPPANMQQRPYYIHHATTSEGKTQPAWSQGRVVLVGDAAHGMPPFMAQGVNQGFEDALAITTLIAKIAVNNHWDNRQAIATAFEKYDNLRRPMMQYIQQATLTRFPHSSDAAWNNYQQQVYNRNFDQIAGLS
ncbi:NAD(P)/FAD-dependent oxidoreductase [Nodularia harveyana UHCC-0300]|uniref:NAD(P)/FAD-dependent oxidoreductase n=1 Tax=Nodularia harveyana UHCC-0300 TaxID=2974287 RepID=A0ABU5UAT3_9CYAN|nr:NAD(P)/FAD-dependent oxidoreductase [Nodularia harveyana]MEA5580269.1 NAD(P)/FAD-dependent oxidoreductase [Nodularia harveyana UHCC-0300]